MDPKTRDSKTADRRVEEARQIKAKLAAKGLKFADIDRTFRLPAGTARQTLREPNLAGERAIAAALGSGPHELWRSRYYTSGQRKSPLDWNKIRVSASSPNREGALT